MTWSGRPIPRFEDPALLRGEGRFTADLPATWRVRFLRSPIAAGAVRVERPADWPGDAHLITLADMPGVQPIRPMLHRFEYVPIAQFLLSDGAVRYVGDLVAAVVARTEEQAEDLADAVALHLDPTDPVMTAEAALAPGAAAVHAGHPNLVVRAAMQTPGYAAAMAGADRVIQSAIRSGRQSGQPIEARAAHAAWDAGTRRITLHCTAQMPHLMRTAIADLLGWPEAELRVVAPDVGGGFGQKMSLAPEYAVVAWLARHLRGSVAWTEDRRENLMASFHSRDMTVSVEGAFDAGGRLLALGGDVLANTGAYAPYPNTAAVEPLMSFAELPGPYVVPEYRCLARGATTNTCPSAPYRGVARPAITLAMERLMDRAAASFGMEPAEIRRRNLVRDFPHTTPTGLIYDDASYVACMDLALEAADVPAFRARQAAALRDGRHLGLGLSVFCERTGYGTPAFAARGMEVTPGYETVQLAMDPSGCVEARIGASPHGQGLGTTLAQIIADAVGVRPDRVRIVHGDTDRTPYGWGTFASRSLVIAGGACLLAGRQLRSTLDRIAGHMLEASDIEIADGVARVAGTDRTIPVGTLARAAHHGSHAFPDVLPGLLETAQYDPLGTFSNAAHVAVVAVDTETCAVAIERFIVAEDAGRLINPMIVDGQIQGGVAQGIANALYEEIRYDPHGDILTTTLADYLLPTAHEVPLVEIHHLVTESEATLTRAKGLGEGGTIGAPAAILNAINDALAPLGATIDHMPATPMRLHAALRAARR